MPTTGNIAQHLGVLTLGTVKETNGSFATTPGYMRNMGASDAIQSGTLAYTTTSTTANLAYTQTNTASPAGVVVLPAGAFIEGIIVDVTTAFNAGTNNSIFIALAPISGTAGTIIYNLVATALTIPIGRYGIGLYTGTEAAPTTIGYTGNGANTNLPYWINVSNGQTTATDQIIQAYFTGTGTAATTGACTITFEYVVRNPDGSWYQQTPAYPITSPPVITY